MGHGNSREVVLCTWGMNGYKGLRGTRSRMIQAVQDIKK